MSGWIWLWLCGLLEVSLLVVWLVVTQWPEILARLSSAPSSPEAEPGPVPAGRRCPACGGSHEGRDVLVGLARDGSRACIEIVESGERVA